MAAATWVLTWSSWLFMSAISCLTTFSGSSARSIRSLMLARISVETRSRMPMRWVLPGIRLSRVAARLNLGSRPGARMLLGGGRDVGRQVDRGRAGGDRAGPVGVDGLPLELVARVVDA